MFEGQREWDYRAQTEKRAQSLPGVTRCAFVCRRCQQSKPTKGRKIRVKDTPRLGYLCADCLAKKEAA